MATFILFLALIIVGFVCGFLLDKYTWHDGLAFTFYIIGVSAAIGLIIASLSLINIDKRFESTLNSYEAITEMVESYDGLEFGNMTALTESVVKMNLTIAQHKAHYTSVWTGPWYSSKIAELKPITFHKKEQKE